MILTGKDSFKMRRGKQEEK